jgi:hypothetical protein
MKKEDFNNQPSSDDWDFLHLSKQTLPHYKERLKSLKSKKNSTDEDKEWIKKYEVIISEFEKH